MLDCLSTSDIIYLKELWFSEECTESVDLLCQFLQKQQMLKKLILNDKLINGVSLAKVLDTVRNSPSVATLTDLELRGNNWDDVSAVKNLA